MDDASYKRLLGHQRIVTDLLANKIDRWEAEIRQRGIEREKALLRRQAEQLAAALAEVTDADRLSEAGDWIVDSATTDDFLSRLGAAGS